MALKQYAVKITKGMNQDSSMQVPSPDTAYKLLNIKNQILDSNSSEVLVNEKGTLYISLYFNRTLKKQITGDILGVVECSDTCIVVFVKESDTVNVIYKVSLDNADNVNVTAIAKGDFKFGSNIKGIFCYENSELQKVYWVDGVNQLRYINIADSNIYHESSNLTGKLPITSEIYMNSSPEFNLNHSITVERIAGGGIFTAGVIQYAFTYYMKYGAETSIVDMTPLYYIGETDRGIEADDTVGCSFRVTINNPDYRFDYIRLYSIQRTSINGTPIVKIVKDIALK